MKVYLVQSVEGEGCYIHDLTELESFFDGAEDGESYTITYSEMTEDEYEALPEFDGF